MTDSLSSGCGADFQESCGTVFLKRECSETRRVLKHGHMHSSVGDRYTGPDLSKQSTVEFSVSGPCHLPEDSHKSLKC